MDNKTLITQLGGKYSTEDDGLFKLKKTLQAAGVLVSYPEGESIVVIKNGIPLTFDPYKSKLNFYQVEINYLKSIKDTDFHIVYNKFKDHLGYIGESASIEMAYALIFNKPIVLLYLPFFSDKVPNDIKVFLKNNLIQIFIERLDMLDKKSLRKYLKKISRSKIDYNIIVTDQIKILERIKKLLNKYKEININTI